MDALRHEIIEIFAGMEGFETETAPEAYLMRIVSQMYEAARDSEQEPSVPVREFNALIADLENLISEPDEVDGFYPWIVEIIDKHKRGE